MHWTGAPSCQISMPNRIVLGLLQLLFAPAMGVPYRKGKRRDTSIPDVLPAPRTRIKNAARQAGTALADHLDVRLCWIGSHDGDPADMAKSNPH